MEYGGGSIRKIDMTTLISSIIGENYMFYTRPTSCSIMKSTGDLYISAEYQLTMILINDQSNIIELAGSLDQCKCLNFSIS
jgi:hypothetical protein